MKQFKAIFYSVLFAFVGLTFTQCKTQSAPQETTKAAPPSRIINSDKSKVCEVFTVENPDLATISQDFADMNLRRQAGDFGPGQYTAFDYWQKVYDKAPGFSILVYTDGSAIYREMAAVAKEEGDDAKFEEYSKEALALLEKGEECYPETQGKFGPAKAYIYELLYPNKYSTILNLYTEGLGADTDPYSLASIARYAKYMGYIGEIDQAKSNSLLSKVKQVAMAKKGQRDYDYALEQITGIEKQYAELEAEKQSQASTGSTGSQSTGETSGAYDTMMSAAQSGNLSQAMSSFKKYIAGIDDVESKYQTAMYIGGVMYQGKDFAKAREAYRVAINADGAKGDPYYYIGMMYLSSGELCGPGTGFDSQRVLWPAFDKLNTAIAKGISADLASDAKSTMSQYKQYLPTKAQLAAEGLSEGASYTVPCWINETTTVRSSGK